MQQGFQLATPLAFADLARIGNTSTQAIVDAAAHAGYGEIAGSAAGGCGGGCCDG